jgi:hypothetical protein
VNAVLSRHWLVFDNRLSQRPLSARHGGGKRRDPSAIGVFLGRRDRPTQNADVGVTHRFAIVPEVLDRETWLRTRGQGLLADGTVPPAPKDAAPTSDDLKPDPDSDRKLN